MTKLLQLGISNHSPNINDIFFGLSNRLMPSNYLKHSKLYHLERQISLATPMNWWKSWLNFAEPPFFFGSTTKCILLIFAACFADIFFVEKCVPFQKSTRSSVVSQYFGRWVNLGGASGASIHKHVRHVAGTSYMDVYGNQRSQLLMCSSLMQKITVFVWFKAKPTKNLSLFQRCQKMPFAPNRHVNTIYIYILTVGPGQCSTEPIA